MSSQCSEPHGDCHTQSLLRTSYLLSTRGSERALPPLTPSLGAVEEAGSVPSMSTHRRTSSRMSGHRHFRRPGHLSRQPWRSRPLTATEGRQLQLCPRIVLPPPDVVAVVIVSTRSQGHATRTVSCSRSARRSARRRRVGSVHRPSSRALPVLDAHVAPSSPRDDCERHLTTPCCSCSAPSSNALMQRSLADVLHDGRRVLP